MFFNLQTNVKFELIFTRKKKVLNTQYFKKNTVMFKIKFLFSQFEHWRQTALGRFNFFFQSLCPHPFKVGLNNQGAKK